MSGPYDHLSINELKLLDVVAAYAVLHNDKPPTADIPDLVPLLVEVAKSNPELVKASEEVRKYYPVCHFDCHINRLNAYIRQGNRWVHGTGPFSDEFKLRVVH